ncbi:anti-sigma factor [Salinicoccus roseus]|uniref:anti-sigma factor n=1 Tax=Salinicoccus roseus TaxID=45670 RepID=UPI001CA6BC75|nr:anti-sigma factor [Salinicoccus roseus]MBY8909014.1 anti-sigma factor [Salinicoccus roseus]
MTHKQPCDQLIDYFNGHLEPEENESFEQHLKTCESCQEELAEWEALNADLVENLPLVDPPEGMKDRVLGNVFSEPSPASEQSWRKSRGRSFRTPFMLAAAALLVSLGANAYMLTAQEESQDLAEVLIEDGRTVTLSPASETLNMDAEVAMHEDENGQTLVLEARNFTNLDEDEVYQIWLMKNEEPYRAGTLVPNEEGNGYVVFSLDEPAEVDWDMVAITIEPSPHNQLPEGEIVMSGEF